MLEKFLKGKKTTFKKEMVAALTTFFTMSYILIVNPRILSEAGMEFQAVFTVTALSAGIACMIMGFLANRPLVLATGMGLNAYFAYTAVLGMGLPWEAVMGAVFVSFAVMFFISISKMKIGEAIPKSFKHALIAGLGLFLVFIGMQNAHFVVINSATIIGLGNMLSPQALIAVIGFLITAILVARKVNGALFMGIITATIVAMAVGLTPLPEAIIGMPPNLESLVLKLDFSYLTDSLMWPVIWALFIISFFDIVGTNIGMLTKAGYADKKGNVSGFKHTLKANSLAGMAGAAIGAPMIITYLESASGIEAGGKNRARSNRSGIIVFGIIVLLSDNKFNTNRGCCSCDSDCRSVHARKY